MRKLFKKYKKLNGLSVYKVTRKDGYFYFQVVCNDCKNKFDIYPPTKEEKKEDENNRLWEFNGAISTEPVWKDIFKAIGFLKL